MGDDLGPGRLVALALGLGPGAQDRLAGHVDPQLGRVEHLDAEDVVLPAVAGAQGLGHGRDADAQQAALGLGLLLALQEALVVDGRQADVEALAVLARVGEEAERRAVREVVVPDEVDPPELGLVHPEVVGRGLDHALLEVHGLGDPERAPVGDAARRLVGVDAAGGQVGGRDVVAGERRVHQPDLELAGLGVGEEGPVVRHGVHAHAEDPAVVAQRQLALEVDVPAEPGRDEVAGLVLDPLHRLLEQDRGQDRDDVAGVHRHLVAEAAAQVGRDDPDHVLGQLGHQRHGGPDDVGRLRGHVDGQLRGRPVEVGDRPAALDRRGVRARVVHRDLGDDVGLGEGPVGAVAVARPPSRRSRCRAGSPCRPG